MYLTGASSATNKVKKTFKFETASNLMIQEAQQRSKAGGSVFASSIDYDQQQHTSGILNDSSAVPTPT